MRGFVSHRILVRVEEEGHDVDRLFPLARFIVDTLLASARKFVVLRLAFVDGNIPFGCDEAFLFELDERGIDRAVRYRECIAARLFDPAGDAIAVDRTYCLKSFEDHEGEGPLPDFSSFLSAHAPPIGVK